MRLLSSLLFILFNIYLVESASRTESENLRGGFDSEKSEFVPGGAREKSDDEEEMYEEYKYDDSKENSISVRSEKREGNSTDSEDSVEGFPNEVFLSLRNITADAATAFRSFTNRNDIVDLQASASDNLNVTANSTFADAESAGINMRALRDAGHPPQIIDDVGGEAIHLPYKHTKIDTADLSDCALQGEWKPMGVAYGHLQVGGGGGGGGEHPTTHQHEVLQSVGSYAVPSKVIPLWQQNHLPSGGTQDLQDGAYRPSGLYGSATATAGNNYGSGFGYASGSGLLTNGVTAFNAGAYSGSNHHTSGSGLAQVHKIKSAAMLSPPPIPPIIFGKKPGYWKLGKTKHKLTVGKGRRPGGYSGGGGFGFSSQVNHLGGYGGGVMSGYLGHGVGGSGHLSHGGAGVVGVYGGGGHKGHGFDGGFLSSGHGVGGGNGGMLSISEGSSGLGEGVGGGAVAEHLVAESGVLSGSGGTGVSVGEELSGEGYLVGGGGGGGHVGGGVISGSGAEGSSAVLIESAGGLSGGHLVSVSHGGVGGSSFGGGVGVGGGEYADSSFSSSDVRQGVRGGNSLPDASFLSSHIKQDLGVHGQGVSDDLSSSSTFTCGKNHDHNTNYHTATFQVADHDHPSSVDVLQYGGDSAVLIQSGDSSFHEQILPERKHYKTSHLSDAEVSSSDNRNELTGQTAKLTSNPTEDVLQVDTESTKADDDEEPERHSYYREITKVTKIPATSVGSVQYTFSQYETKPQTFSTESDAIQDEPEVEQPQIIRELEHLSNKFQLDLENPQKLFEDPPSQELAYHYPFHDGENHQDAGKGDIPREEGHQGITDFPYQFYNSNNNNNNNNNNKLQQYPAIYKKPVLKYIPRPPKPHFYQKTTVNYLQPRPPLVVIRKPKPKHFLKKKQNYEVREHGGERHRPLGEIFPPQKSPKQFHNPKPNFAVERPKNGWRTDVQEYKYDHSHGKKVRKFNTKAKVLAPVLIRRPVSPGPVIRVVEVAG